MKKIKDSQIEVIINSLCSNMFSSSERLRDISSVGLKTVISEFPRTTPAVATTASRNITGKMVDAIGKPVSEERGPPSVGEEGIMIIKMVYPPPPSGFESICSVGNT